MAKLTGFELVRMVRNDTTKRTREFFSIRSNGKIVARTNWLHENGKKSFGTGWKLVARIKNWKGMDDLQRDDVTSDYINIKAGSGWQIVPGTRATASV